MQLRIKTKRKKILSIFFLLVLSNLNPSVNADTASPQLSSSKNQPSKIDYTFSNPDFTLAKGQQILSILFPKTAQEVADPYQFYNLASICYAKKLDRVYYHLLPIDAPKIVYFWFDSPKIGCAFGAYYLGTLEASSGIPRGKICPLNSETYTLFSPDNVKLVSDFEKSGQKSDAMLVFATRTLYCLDMHPLTTEQLQSLFRK